MWRCFYFALLISLVAREIHSFTGLLADRRSYCPTNDSRTKNGSTLSPFQTRNDNLFYSSAVVYRTTVIFSQTPSKTKSKSFVDILEQTGQRLMPMALEAKEQSMIIRNQYTTTMDKRFSHRAKSFLYSVKSCVLFSLFILYRAYRGFFVLLPAVFQQSYAKLKAAVDSPFVEEEIILDNTLEGTEDINPRTGQVRLRTRVVVSILSMIVVTSFVINGALEVLGKFLSTIRKSRSMETSFEAAAEKVLINEDKVQKYTVNKKEGKVNGRQ